MHNLSCENEFYLHENEKSFPFQRLSTYPRFETEARKWPIAKASEAVYKIDLALVHYTEFGEFELVRTVVKTMVKLCRRREHVE